MSDPRFAQKGFTKKLAKLVEECGETLAAAGKLQRWGRMSVNPLLPPSQQETNIDWLSRELKDLHEAIHEVEALIKKGEFDDPPVYDGNWHNEPSIAWENPGENKRVKFGGAEDYGIKVGGTD